MVYKNITLQSSVFCGNNTVQTFGSKISSSSALSFDRSILASTFSITLYSLFFSSSLHTHLPSIHSAFQVFFFLWVSFHLFFPQLPPLVNHFLVEHVQSIFFGLNNSYQLSPFPIIVRTSSLVFLSVQLTFSILQTHISKASILWIMSEFTVHVSDPYKNTLQTTAFTIFLFTTPLPFLGITITLVSLHIDLYSVFLWYLI